jgi:hypothetical protein
MNLYKKIIATSLFIFINFSMLQAESCAKELEHPNHNEKYESALKEYVQYLKESVTPSIRTEESKYFDNLHSIDKKIQDLYKQINELNQHKVELYNNLSKDCKEHLRKKDMYEKKMLALKKNINTKVSKAVKKLERKK